MEVVNELREKVKYIEQEEIKEIKDKVNKIEMDVVKMSLLTEQSITTTTKLTDAMNCMKETMIEMSHSIKQSNEAIKQSNESIRESNENTQKLAESVNVIGRQVNSLEDKVLTIDNRGKIDLWELAKKYPIPLILSLITLLIATKNYWGGWIL